MNYSSNGIKKKLNEIRSHKSKIEKTVLVYVFKGFILLCIFGSVALCCLGAGSLRAIIDTAPKITLNDVTPSQYKTTIYDSAGKPIETLVASGANRIYATIDEIPVDLQHAFIAIEDERFYQHNGIDAKGIMRAAYIGISSGFNFTQGASTLTQQLIKNSVFAVENENSLGDRLKRKIQEQYLAVNLEKDVNDKQLILENYLNIINLGNNNLGVQSAARNYFDKDVSQLNISECAVIAAITQNPSYYNPVRYPEHNKERRQLVLDNMLEQNYITKEQHEEAVADDVYARIQNVHSSKGSSVYSYYTDALIPEIMDDLMTQKGYSYTQAYNLVYRGGLSIYSCEDSKLQKYAESLVNDPERWNNEYEILVSYRFQIRDDHGTLSSYNENGMLEYMKKTKGDSASLIFTSDEAADEACERYKNYVLKKTGGTVVEGSEKKNYALQPQISMVVTEHGTGMVRVIIGGRGDKEESMALNRATSSLRQPGSTIKPIGVYGPALDSCGLNLATVFDDAPFYYDNGQLVNNYDFRFKGYLTIRQSLAESRNIGALKTLQTIGINTAISYLENLGISTLTEKDYYLPLALGTCNATNLEMNAAYCAIANKGQYIKPRLYTKVVDHDGNIILDNTIPETKQVFKETTAYLISSAMHSVTTIGALKNQDFGDMYVCAKTGTTQNDYDKWGIGFSAKCTVSIWSGYDLNKVYNHSKYGTPYWGMWRKVLIKANEGADCSEPEPPAGIVKCTICKDSGLLAVDGLCNADPRGDRVTTEYFAEGQQPTSACKVHTKVKICNSTHLVAGEGCPHSKSTVIRIIKDKPSYNTKKFDVEDSYLAITKEELNNKCN